CVPWIMQALPGARVLHLVGGPMDTCFANLTRWAGHENGWSRDQEETADHYRRYRALMAHMRGLYPDRVHDVRHDELAENPAAALREAVEFCGLQWDERLPVDAPQGGAPAGSGGTTRTNWARCASAWARSPTSRLPPLSGP